MIDVAVTASDGVTLRTHVDGPGDAPSLLLCNSLGTDLGMWDPQMSEWATRFRVIRFDTRGHGNSAVTEAPYTIDLLGHDALAVLDGLGIARAHVCGLSLGGQVALWLGIHAPDRVERLVLADTAAKVGTEEGWRARTEVIRAEGMGAIRDAVLERFFSAAFRSRDPGTVSAAGDTLEATDAEGYIGACLALATSDLRAEAGQVTAPTLVVVGDADEATPPTDAQALVDAIAGSRLATIPGAGHLANLEEPAQFTALVRDFLSGG